MADVVIQEITSLRGEVKELKALLLQLVGQGGNSGGVPLERLINMSLIAKERLSRPPRRRK